ncbi:hypothetical protein BCY91_12030 [Pelobium manganitolerans]|uniref:Uncharacterized protein n=1 Tax=Pelobium manganitolerans TaxID=1842495 RepID=A0A419S1L1_9SPHI|nr:hypothetical protein [Pelobium manganitolerans]RKD12374.1 hypothetical protein BCY91_12030 [Pelobium manganitolerans]
MGNQNEMDKDTLELVLQEFAEEQKITSQNINNLIQTTHSLTEKLRELEGQIKEPKPVNLSTDTKPFQQLLQKGMLDIKLMIGNQPKSIQRKFQILLFPEQDAKLFYRIVFGRWFLWLTVMLALTNLYKWGVNYNNNQKEIEMEQLENDRIRKSWNYLYKNSDQNVQMKMDKAFKNFTLEANN